ncbi:MAG: helix-turn-helix transcriptional regulator [Actinomycetota bacterium]|nr:helix-turn-helix transcriptional regulator [Actinomycetota bacterium]
MEARGTDAQGISRRFDIDDLDVLDRRAAPRRRSDGLTERERDVLERLAEGRPTEEVATLLHVSPHTVRSRIKTVLRKLGARNREHAVAIALREGAIDPEI